MKLRQKPAEKVWDEFAQDAQLNDEQLEQFQKYATYLLEVNELFNLTAITELSGVVRNHFLDSLALSKFVDLSKVTTLCDVGTGAGFPAIPLKIMFPHLKLVLIEVTKKKRDFLNDVIRLLNLEDVEICDLDWRTFLRKTTYPIDLFVTRAALDDLELNRMFRGNCPYNKTTLVYWVAKLWEPHVKSKPFILRTESYKVGNKDRMLVFLGVNKT